MPDSERVGAEAWRLVINYRAGHVVLDDVIPLDKLLPPSDDLPAGGPEGELAGFWFELRDGSGRTTYRQIESNPLVHACSDVIADREGGGTELRRLAAVADDTTFTFLIPRPRGDGAHVVIFSSPPDAVAQGISVPAEPRWRIQLPVDQPE